VVSNFIMQALKGEALTIYGDGLQTRSFCYRDDLVAGLVALGLHETPIATPINLGNPAEFNLLELADLVLELTGASSKRVFLPLPQDDPRQRRPDITRARELLNWSPQTGLREGLSRTIEGFRQSMGRDCMDNPPNAHI
jgi:UDP-glucuronate decarboxylase